MPTGRTGRKKWPFAAGIVVILATVSWLAYSGIQESKTYYVTVSELFTNQDLQSRRLRVAGDVTTGSIAREDGRVRRGAAQIGPKPAGRAQAEHIRRGDVLGFLDDGAFGRHQGFLDPPSRPAHQMGDGERRSRN